MRRHLVHPYVNNPIRLMVFLSLPFAILWMVPMFICVVWTVWTLSWYCSLFRYFNFRFWKKNDSARAISAQNLWLIFNCNHLNYIYYDSLSLYLIWIMNNLKWVTAQIMYSFQIKWCTNKQKRNGLIRFN